MKRIENKFLTSALALGMLLSVQTLSAYEDRPEKPQMNASKKGMDVKSRVLERHDKDGDGKISKAEARGGMADNFARHDLDEDGYISTDAEFDTLPKHPPRRGGKQRDGGQNKGDTSNKQQGPR